MNGNPKENVRDPFLERATVYMLQKGEKETNKLGFVCNTFIMRFCRICTDNLSCLYFSRIGLKHNLLSYTNEIAKRYIIGADGR